MSHTKIKFLSADTCKVQNRNKIYLTVRDKTYNHTEVWAAIHGELSVLIGPENCLQGERVGERERDREKTEKLLPQFAGLGAARTKAFDPLFSSLPM